jgi:hypothetical protein
MGTDCPQRVHCCLPSCWSAGSGFFLKEVVSDFCIEVVCTMRVIGLIRNFFEEVLGLVARYSRTFLVRNSELFKAKAC